MDFVSSTDSAGLAGPGKAEITAGGKKPRVKVGKRRRVVHPPPELLVLSSTTTLKSLQQASQDAFRSVYRMFLDFEVRRLHVMNDIFGMSALGDLNVDNWA